MSLRPHALQALLFASSAAASALGGQAAAAEPGPSAGPDSAAVAEADQQATNLGVIDVNGRRRRQEPQSPEFTAPLVDTPRAVTVIPEQIIEQTAATSLQDLLRTSPGITFGAGEGGQPLADRPFIRGQASGNNIFVDGIRDTGGQQREVFVLEQVEVVKGPDGVYSGRGSGGGAINLATKKPTAMTRGHASLGAGTDNYWRVTVDQNWSLGEGAGLRVNLMGSAGDVPGRTAVDFDKWGAAVALGAGLGTDTRAVFSYYHLTSNQMPDYGIPLFTKTGVRTDPSGILDVPRESFYGLKARDYLVNEVDSFTFDFQRRFGEGLTIRNVTRWSQTLNDYIVTNPADGGYVGRAADGTYWMKRGTKSRYNPVTTLANVTDVFGTVRTGRVEHSYDVGLELSQEENRNATYSTYATSGTGCPMGLTLVSGAFPTSAAVLGPNDCTRVYAPNPDDPWTGVINRSPISRADTDTLGLYAFDSITLTERLILSLGLRYDRYAVEGLNVTATQAGGVWTTTAVARVPRAEWDFVNYQAGLVFKPTRQTSVYAAYATSATPPTVSAGDQNTATGTGTGNLATTLLDPEQTTNVEIGAKASLLRDQLQLSAALFQLERKDAQIQVAPGVYEQAGEARVRGVELGASGNITPAWQVFGGYTWMDSELVAGAFNNVNVGDPLANTPEHSFSLFTTYRLSPPLSLGGGVYHVSKSFGGNQGGAGGGANRIYAPAYTRLDLFAAYDLSERASLQLNVQNAGDEAYIMRTNGVHHADVAPGRQAILTLNLRY